MASHEDPEYIIDLELNFERPELTDFLAYWKAKRGTRKFPRRVDIVPREIQSLLPWVHMYDFLNPSLGNNDTTSGGIQFRIRLIGTALESNFPGTGLRGQPMSALPSPVSEHVQRHLTMVTQIQKPLRTQYSITGIPGQEFQSSESCYAPLSTNGTDIDIIIAVTFLENRK